MNLLRKNAELVSCAARYMQHREHTYVLLEEEALRQTGMRVQTSEICIASLKEAKAWQNRIATWDWETDVLQTLRKSHPRRLEMAFRVSNELCGLAVARVSDAKVWVSITHMEGKPGTHPLSRKICALSIKAADIFSALIHDESSDALRPQVRLMNPLKNAIACYAHNGYSNFHQQNGYSFLCNF
jgi:hypothetical protein